MYKVLSILTVIFILFNVTAQLDFLANQKRYQRVRSAISEKQNGVIEKLAKYEIAIKDLNILILVYKAEGELQLFAKKKTKEAYIKLATYQVCSKSGVLGPKRKQGDYQVPEGFYFIDRFNPASSYHLSLGINYPNQSDRKSSNATNLGGDIFIHGECVTIGCLPMTNDKIKEIYLYAINAKNNGQHKIPVYIFPFKMTDQKFNEYKKRYSNKKKLIDFWATIKAGYDTFNTNKRELRLSFTKEGNYNFK
jgi:murein L,D-transpeptidase YafK